MNAKLLKSAVAHVVNEHEREKAAFEAKLRLHPDTRKIKRALGLGDPLILELSYLRRQVECMLWPPAEVQTKLVAEIPTVDEIEEAIREELTLRVVRKLEEVAGG